jgi:hypothetical protein
MNQHQNFQMHGGQDLNLQMQRSLPDNFPSERLFSKFYSQGEIITLAKSASKESLSLTIAALMLSIVL